MWMAKIAEAAPRPLTTNAGDTLSAMSPQMQLDQVKTAMAEVNRLFNEEVVGKRNMAALDNVYTADARILPPGGPMVSGREAIKQFWAGMIQAVNAKAAEL